jgi:hypothetical protein
LTEIAAVRAAATRVAADVTDTVRWTRDERHRMLTDLDRTIDVLTAARAAVLVAERDAGTWRGDGDGSVESWWARTSGAGRRAAAAQVRQADHLHAAPPAATAAVADGRIRVEHAAAIGAVVAGGTPTLRDAAQSPAGEEHLIEMAEGEDAGTFTTDLGRWAATVDPAAHEADHQAQRRARFLQVSHTPRGTFLKGRLDSMAGRRLTLALEAVSPRPGADDDRDAGQRCADALDTIATRTIAAADTKPGAHVPVQISLILTEETWLAARAERDRRRHTREDAAADSTAIIGDTDSRPTVAGGSEPGYPPATLEDGTPVPASALAAAMCDCEITRIVLDADSVPLDVGRAQRVFTGPQRRAVIARDRECAWPHCPAHARWCEVHHLRWWERDTGPTSVDNGVLLCSFHHHEVHRQDLTITRVVPARNRGKPASGSLHTITAVTYEFRDATGRIVGPKGSAPPAAGRPVAGAPDGPSAPGRSRTGSAPPMRTSTSGADRPTPTPSAETVPRQRVAPDTTEPAEIEWAEDPMTGMTVPTFFSTRDAARTSGHVDQAASPHAGPAGD